MNILCSRVPCGMYTGGCSIPDCPQHKQTVFPAMAETREQKISRLMREITERQQELTHLILGDPREVVSSTQFKN